MLKEKFLIWHSVKQAEVFVLLPLGKRSRLKNFSFYSQLKNGKTNG